MMYYRRKLLLAILQKRNNRLDKIDLQKLLFLVTREQEKPCFDFVPYKSGCYSFQANKDLEVLSRHYLLIDNKEKSWFLKKNTKDYFSELNEKDQENIKKIFESNHIQEISKLTNFVDNKYPYFSINSELKLNDKQKKKQEQEKKKIETNEKKFFSIGYEGISIDTYLNLLIKNNIKSLCDVRKNSFSMKYDFSKNQLSTYCENIGIKYSHISNLGIDSHLRKNLDTDEDYYNLFKKYKSRLKENKSLKELEHLFNQYKRVAVTCFEKDHKYCHRNILVEYYIQNIEKISIIHL